MERNLKTASLGKGVPTIASVGIMNIVYIISGLLALMSAYLGRDSVPYAMSMLALSGIFVMMLILNKFSGRAAMNGKIVTITTTLWLTWMSVAFAKEMGHQNYLIIGLIALLIFSRKGLFRTFSIVLLIILATIVNFYQYNYAPLFQVPELTHILSLTNTVTPLVIVAIICWKAIDQVTESRAVIELQQQQLLESIQFKDKILAIIGHDMRTPFSSAKSIVYLLESDMLTDKEHKEVITQLSSLIDVSLQTLDNILGWASQGYYGSVLKAKVKAEQLNPYKMAETTMTFFKHQAAQKKILFKNEIDPAITFAGDQEQISFVIRNITSNALKFSHAGQTITFTAIEDLHKVTFSVIDQGVGMTEEFVESLFKVSTRVSTEGTVQEKGTGLGLLFCKDFVEANGGELSIISYPGSGTTVRISLSKTGGS